MRSGKPRERKTREMPSRPACGLVASWRGRSSRTKGVLCSKGKRAAMKRYIEYLYYIVNKKDANYSTFFENPKIRRGSGSRINLFSAFYTTCLLVVARSVTASPDDAPASRPTSPTALIFTAPTAP